MTVLVLFLLIGLAAANGANDVSKGVATLAGAGVSAYRTAVLWGAVTTLVGALLSVRLGRGLGKLFSAGIVTASPTNAFALAVLAGTASWVILASLLRMPVSTTHAIVGSLVGAGLQLPGAAVHWHAVVQKVALPLALSIVVAYGISVALTLLAGAAGRLARPRRGAPQPVRSRVAAGSGPEVLVVEPAERTGAAGTPGSPAAHPVLTGLHWLSSGAASCARGLNDTPKIAAIGGFALVPAGYTRTSVALIVAVAMAGGSLLGVRVARTLGEKVLRLNHAEGLRANATTAALVGAGALLALPMSTTHVSTGAIAGGAGLNLRRLNPMTIRDLLVAWTITPAFAAFAASVAFMLAS